VFDESMRGPIDRRSFLRRSAASVIAAKLGGSSAANAMMHATKLGAIGIQLYTVRGLMEKDVAGTLAAIAKIGYKEVEFAGLFGKTPAEVRAMLDADGLVATSSHISTEDIRTRWPRTLDDAATLGQRYIVCAWIDENERTPDGLKKIADDFNRAADAAKRHGLQFAYHNHDFEFTPMTPGGAKPYDVLLASTDASLVKMEADLFWMVSAGQKPLAYFAKWPGRFPLVHVKDRARDGKMVDVGQGAIDFKAIFAKSTEAGIEHYFVEHDEPPKPLEDARLSYDYLRRLEF
jgi:sugar phosphate isomerase/epimerase